MPVDAPFVSDGGAVLPGWVNDGGHMGLAYYVLMFDAASDALFDAMGLGRAYLDRTGNGYFAVETHLIYEREMHLGDHAVIHSTVTDADDKRICLAHEMYRKGETSRVCLQEIMFLSVGLETRRVQPWAPEIAASIRRALALHGALPRPAKLGRRIEIKR